MGDRLENLEDLLELKRPVDEITDALACFDWDSEELVTLEVCHVRQVLERYISGEIGGYVVESWANTIECRDDIGMASSNEDLIEQVVYELANPDLAEALTPHLGQKLIERLSV